MRKFPIIQHVESDSRHSSKRLKRGGTTRICKAVKYNGCAPTFREYLLTAKQLRHPKLTITRNSAAGYWSTFRALLKEAYERTVAERKSQRLH